jgi:hypothetical protein
MDRISATRAHPLNSTEDDFEQDSTKEEKRNRLKITCFEGMELLFFRGFLFTIYSTLFNLLFKEWGGEGAHSSPLPFPPSTRRNISAHITS